MKLATAQMNKFQVKQYRQNKRKCAQAIKTWVAARKSYGYHTFTFNGKAYILFVTDGPKTCNTLTIWRNGRYVCAMVIR